MEPSNYNNKKFKIISLGLSNLLKELGNALVNEDPHTTQIFFESIVLDKLVEIILRYQNKKEHLIPLIYSYCPGDSLSRLRIIKKVKELLSPNLNGFIGMLSQLVSISYDEEMDDEAEADDGENDEEEFVL